MKNNIKIPGIHIEIPVRAVFISIFVGATVVAVQETLFDLIGIEVYPFLFTSTIAGFIIYKVLDIWFIPITELKDRMDKFPNLNLKLVNNYDEDMDSMNDVLDKISDQIKSENKTLNDSQYIARSINSLKKVKSILAYEKIKSIDEDEISLIQSEKSANEILSNIDINEIEGKGKVGAFKTKIQATIDELQTTLEVLKPLSRQELEDTEEIIKLKSSSKVQEIELNAPTVWGMSSNLKAEIEDERVRNNVVKSLRGDYKSNKKKSVEARYCYIVPESPAIKNNIKKLKMFWKKNGVSNLQISRVWFIKIPQSNWLQAHDVAIYDYGLDNEEIIEFITMHNSGNNNDTFIYRTLDDDRGLVETVESAMLDDKKNSRDKYGKNTKGFFNFESEHFLEFLISDLTFEGNKFGTVKDSEGLQVPPRDMNGQDIKITQSLKEEWIEKCHELQKDKGKA
jgi:hypothetical protein